MLKENTIVGFYAIINGQVACHGNSLIVINTKIGIKNFIKKLNAQGAKILKMKLGDLLYGLEMGGVYDLDSASFKIISQAVDIGDYNIKEQNEDGVLFYTVKILSFDASGQDHEHLLSNFSSI